MSSPVLVLSFDQDSGDQVAPLRPGGHPVARPGEEYKNKQEAFPQFAPRVISASAESESRPQEAPRLQRADLIVLKNSRAVRK